MIQFKAVSKIYPNGHVAINNVSFNIDPGALVCLTGAVTTGKSTILDLILANETPSQGEIIVAGKELNRLSQRGIAKLRRSIGIAPQQTLFLPESTVLENVALPLFIHGHGHQERKKRATIALEKIGLVDKARFYPNMLSAGELQLANLARAIVNLPKIILIDEPTNNLDTKTIAKVSELLVNLNDGGITILMATSNLKFISTMQRHNAVLIDCEGC